MNVFKKLFGFKDKDNTEYTGNRPEGLYGSDVATQLRDVLKARAGGTGTGAEKISGLGDAYTNLAERNWRQKELPALESAQGYANIASTPQGVQSIANRYGDIQAETAVNRENMGREAELLRQQGITNALSGLGNLSDRERAARAEMTAFDERDFDRQRNIKIAREEQNRQGMANALEFGTKVLGGLNMPSPMGTPNASGIRTSMPSGADATKGYNWGGLQRTAPQGANVRSGGTEWLKIAKALGLGGL